MEIKINNVSGISFATSSNIYDVYKESGDKNDFELVLDGVILEKYSDDDDLKKYIKSLPKENKRVATLSLLSDDNVLWSKINELIKEEQPSYQRLKNVYNIIKDYVKIADVERKKHGEILTPFKELAEPMVRLVESYDPEFWKNKNHKVLDSSAGYGTFLILVAYKFMVGLKDVIKDEEERFKWIVENCLYYGELQARSVFSWLVAIDPFDKYKTNIFWGDFLTEDFDKHMKDVWNIQNGWDLIIQNPPYKNGVHIHFFNKSFDLLNENKIIIFVHPSTQFINRKDSKEDSKTKKIKSIVENYECRLHLIDGNYFFKAGFFTPLSITSIKKVNKPTIEVIYSHINTDNKDIITYKDLSKINIHGNEIVNDITIKIKNKMKLSIEDMLFRNSNISKIGKYFKICRISGHPPKIGGKIINPDFFQLIYKENEKNVSNLITENPIGKRDDGNQFNELIINDLNEIDNIHNYLMTKFARFCLSIYKNSANILSDLKIVPYMDFSKKWSDKDLFEYFDLSESEVEFILDYIPDWYEKDKIKKELKEND